MYLAAVNGPVEPSEVRRFWNVKESPKLDRIISAGSQGTARHGKAEVGDDGRLRGSAGRVFSLMFLRGTTPWYCIPVLDERLEAENIDAMRPIPDDLLFDSEPADAVARFLAAHRGSPVLIEERLRAT
jgi:hypothetical protein